MNDLSKGSTSPERLEEQETRMHFHYDAEQIYLELVKVTPPVVIGAEEELEQIALVPVSYEAAEEIAKGLVLLITEHKRNQSRVILPR